jgi:hypothetical protein
MVNKFKAKKDLEKMKKEYDWVDESKSPPKGWRLKGSESMEELRRRAKGEVVKEKPKEKGEKGEKKTSSTSSKDKAPKKGMYEKTKRYGQVKKDTK